MNINISGEVVRTSQLPKRIIGLGDYLVALNSSPLETSTVLVSDFVSFLNTQFATSLASLTDVSINGPLPGQALVFNGSYWVNQNLVSSLAGLSDVTIASLNPNQLLRYDGTSWKNWTPTFYSLPAGGTTLQYIDGTGALQTLPTSLPTSTVRHQVKAGVPITKGQAVYVTSADGTNMIVGLASNASEATSSKTMGLLDATVSTNGFANVVTEGLLTGLDTTGANAAGDPVWLGTNGNLIYGLVNKPYAPNHLVFIGIVTRRNANNGEIFVKVQNGFELDELHNVDARNPSNNDGIFYNSTTQLWEHKQISAVAPTPTLAQVTTAGNTTTNNITIGTLFFGNGNHYLVTDNGSYAMLSSNRTLQLATSGNPVLSVFTSQNVAIGTTTDLGYKLDVNGLFRTTSTTHLATAGGLVGIGTTSPSTILHIQSGVGGRSELVLVKAMNAAAEPGLTFANTLGSLGMIGGISGGGLYFQNQTAEVMRITSTGKVGIGTTSPSTVFHVDTSVTTPAVRLSDFYYDYFIGYGDVGTTKNNNYWQIYRNGSQTYYNQSSGGHYFVSNATDLLRILQNGNVLIGTITDAGYKLDVNGTGRYVDTIRIAQSGFLRNADITMGNTLWINASHGGIQFAFAGNNIVNFGGTNNQFFKQTQIGYGTSLITRNASLSVGGSITASTALAQGILYDGTLVPSASGDLLNALEINPTFSVGSGTLLSYSSWIRLTGNYNPSAYTTNNNAVGIDLSNGYYNTFNAVGIWLRPTLSNVQNAYGIIIDNTQGWAIYQSNASVPSYFKGTTYLGDVTQGSLNFGSNNATLNVANGTNGGIKIGTGGNSEHLIISHSQAGATSSSIRNTYNNASSTMLIDVAGQNNLRLWGTGNVIVGGTTDAGYKLDVNGTARINSSLYVTDPSYTLSGRFYQAGNATTVISGGPAGENITFGPSNRIFINATQTRVQSLLQTAGGLSVGTFNYPGTYGAQAYISGSTTANAGGGRGLYIDSTIVAAANNDVLVGLDIAPTFTNGAFTGVKNIGLRVPSNVLIGGTTYYTQTNTGQPITSALQINGNISLISSSTTDRFNLIGSDPSTFWQARLDGAYGLSTIIGINSLSGNYNGTISPAIVTGLGMEIAGTLAVQTRIATKGPVTLDGSTNRYIRFWEPGVAKRAVIGHTDSADGGHIVIRTGDATTLADGTQAVRVFQTTQNVLIGSSTTDAGYKLDVNGTGRFSGNLEVNAGNNGQIFINNVYPRLLFGKTGTPSWSIGADTENSGQFEIGTGAGFPYNTFTSRVYISTAGNVGIGTTAPAYKLDVVGGIRSTYLTTSVVHGEGNTLLLLSGLNGANPGVNEARLHLGYNQNDPVVRLNSNGVSVSTGTWFFLPQTWFAGGITSNHNSALTIDGMSNGVTSGVASEIIRFTQRNGQFANFYDAGAGLSEFRIWQQANSNNYIYLKPGQTSYFSTGSLVIGGTTDAGYKLDVNGNAILRSGTLNLVGNYLGISGSCADVNIFNNCGSGGSIGFTLGGNRFFNIWQVTGSSSGNTSGTHSTLSSSPTYAWSSGNAISNLFVLSPTINNTGTYSGIFRGFYYNPTLTSLTGTTHRGMEITSGDFIWGNGYSQYYGDSIEGFVQFQSSGNSTKIWIRPSGSQGAFNNNYWGYLENSGYTTTLKAGQYHDLSLAADTIRFKNQYLTEVARFVGSSGNLLLGTTTDSGYKLDVNGTTRVKGSGSTSATSSLLIQNSGGTTAFQVKDNLQVDFGGIVRLTNGDVYVNLTSPSSDAFATGVFGSLNFYVNAGGRTKSNRILAEDINGIGTLDNSAILQANSTTQGFLPPRLTTAQILAITSPAEGLQVYNTDLKTICFYNGTAWQRVTSTAM